MKARIYKFRTCKNCGRAQGDTPCAEFNPGPKVTAIDSRDVVPLLAAAREVVAGRRPATAAIHLRRALEPFTPDTGGEDA